MNDWNSIYRAQGIIQPEASPRVLEALAAFERRGHSRVLDLGCGTGRHTTALIDRGFEVFGCDTSAEALAILGRLAPGIDLQRCEMTGLPYTDAFFDAVVCNHVLQHGRLADVRRAAGEIRRVLRPGGGLFLAVVSTEHPKSFTGTEIEPNTRIGTDGLDGHVPHHFFSEPELRDLFSGFDVDDLIHAAGPSELTPGRESAAWFLTATRT